MNEILEPGSIAPAPASRTRHRHRSRDRQSHGNGGRRAGGRRQLYLCADALKVKAGTTVTCVNHDDIPHNIVCPALKVHSHALDTDDSFTYKFDQAGSFDYLCADCAVVAFLE